MTIDAAVRATRSRQSLSDKSIAELTSDTTRDTFLAKLTRYIPAEIIAAWGGILGLLSPTSTSTRWWVFAAVLVVLNALLLIDLRARDSEAMTDPELRRTTSWRATALCLFVSAMFCAWSLASPGSPLPEQSLKIALAVAVLLTVLADPIARLLDIKPGT